MAFQKHSKGFTLIELMITIAVIGVFAVMGIPQFTTWIERARLRSAARTVYADMQIARVRAMETGGPWRIDFDSDGNSYSLISAGPDMLLDTNDDVTVKTVDISNQFKTILFGTERGPVPGLSEPDDGISFPGNDVQFLPQGSAVNGGTVYLKNSRGETFAVVLSFNNARIRLTRNYDGHWEG